ncbi:D-sedoheptulose 7-phosphate isomerase [Kordiimonas sp. A6E486]|nr:D-sedoheptulose 7-phosphate isomerase [Kordiimonas marina]
MKANSHLIVEAGDMLCDALRSGGKVMFCGNGGSAADSQHLAAELMGRFLIDRKPLPSLALTVDTSVLTAVGNDYGYDHVFSRQLTGIGSKGDVLVGLSTSGNSKNVIEAFAKAREMGIKTVGLTGVKGGVLADKCDLWLPATASRTDHIQELHIAIGHLLCGIVEARFAQPV